MISVSAAKIKKTGSDRRLGMETSVGCERASSDCRAVCALAGRFAASL